MRTTLWSRAARPKLNGCTTSASTLSPCRPAIIRQTTSGPIRRHLTVNDVFTLLLTPILATALLADTSWKDKRRKDWAHSIAEIEAETEQIQSRATRSWQILQSRSLGLGAAQQRRQYSAVALREQPEDNDKPPLREPEVILQHLPVEEWEREPIWFEATPNKAHDSVNEVPERELASFTPQAVERSERLRRLLAIKLALNLTLWLNTGVSPSKVRRELRIPGTIPDILPDAQTAYGLPKLLHQLRELCSTIEELEKGLPDGASPVRSGSLGADSQKLQDDISMLSKRYQTNSIEMPEFITSYTLAVLRSPVPPTSKAYLALFRGFTRGSISAATSHESAMQILFAWEQSKLPIDHHDLFVILSELARRKHVQKFDGLMRDLTMLPSPINVTDRWTWEQANDIQVPVPISRHPALLTTLVHCALRFDQPHKAEAWSEILRRTWINVNDPTQKTPLQILFTNWMRYYEVQGNWRQGVVWLDAAQKWAITVASFDMYSLQRLAVGMLALCFACGKSREYEEILSAAIDSGIPSMNPEHFLDTSSRRAICREWQHLYRQAYRRTVDSRTDHEKVQAFQSKVRAVAQRLLPKKDGADLEWRYEQDLKPSPLTADPGEARSGQFSTITLALWQRIHAKNQEALNTSRTDGKRWEMQCTKQEQRIRSLQSELEYQNKLVQELTGPRTITPSPNQMENKIRKAERGGAAEGSRLRAAERRQAELVHQSLKDAKAFIEPSLQPQEVEVAPIVLSDDSHPPTLRSAQEGTELRAPGNFLPLRSEPWKREQHDMPEGDLSHTDFLLSHLVKEPRSASAQG
jgi:hypothetical protein